MGPSGMRLTLLILSPLYGDGRTNEALETLLPALSKGAALVSGVITAVQTCVYTNADSRY